MSSSCPRQEDTLCTHVLCMGEIDECSPNTFLNGCKCHMGDCPASNRLQMFCEETDCGGQNPRTGLCKGVRIYVGYKNVALTLIEGGGWQVQGVRILLSKIDYIYLYVYSCYCGTSDGLERYRFQESSFDTLDRIVSINSRPNTEILY